MSPNKIAKSTHQTGAHQPTDQNKVLWLLALAMFLVVLDSAIINVALPAIKSAMHFNDASLQWVVTGYVLTFGGFLMLGGRTADLYGRRRVLVIGIAGFIIFRSWPAWPSIPPCSLLPAPCRAWPAPSWPPPPCRSCSPPSRKARRATTRCPFGASWPRAALRPACSWAACSPSTSAGAGASS
jgi:MFS family permease